MERHWTLQRLLSSLVFSSLIFSSLIFSAPALSGCQRSAKEENSEIGQYAPKDENDRSEKSKPLLTMSHNGINYTVKSDWLAGPYGTVSKKSALELRLTSDSVPLSLPEGVYLEFYATMPSMGHPMDRAGFFEEVNPGVYQNHGITFQMPGDWRIHLYLVDEANDKIISEVTWDILF